MSLKTYHGSCHCGRVRYEAKMDLSEGTGKCNCSICAKSRLWAAMLKPDAFKLVSGEAELSDYQFGSHSVHHYFCKNCGIRPFGKGHIKEIGGDFYVVNVATLDDVDVKELTQSPIRYSDGRNNNWHEAPAEFLHL
jgi:hypothetical protein